ncbi:MAG: adenylosuccinate synthase [Nitrospirae bacterium]|nr:MAG: adenylosuccinate synthase [Nitrospirota bacterium]
MANAVVVLGTQWGDEGKGKLVDYITNDADLVVRYQGGNNAGHTVVIGDETFILHLIPSGILHPEKLCIIGNGLVVNPQALIEEIDGLKEKGITIDSNLKLSRSAHLIMPYHMAIEAAREEAKGKKQIGTTRKGIGPAYVDKSARTGLRAGDLLYPEVLREKIEANLREINFLLKNLYNQEGFTTEEIYNQYLRYAERLGPYIADTDVIINKALDEGKRVLFEGAQGTLLDIDHGTYPYVTSSSASAGGVCTGTGVGPTRIDKVLGVVKAYTTRVGGGPFPTEIKDPLGERLRERGGEYGATTGRPRRCGWLDLVALRHAKRVNDLKGLLLTKLDILDGLETIKVCYAYRYRGEVLEEFPKDAYVLEECEPLYKEMKGWAKPTSGVRDYESLPSEARAYIEMIEEELQVPVVLISTGQKREDVILRGSIF